MPRRSSQKDRQRQKGKGTQSVQPKPTAPSSPQKPLSITQSRTLYLSHNLLGHLVEVQVKDGSWYQGIYCNPPVNSGFGAIIDYARKIESREGPGGRNKLASELIPHKVIKPDEIVQLYAKDITFVADMGDRSSNQRESFKTDTAISRSGKIQERELQPWKPDDDVPQPVWAPSSGDSSWDQFSTNEKLFGVKTTFNEDMYTTKLDKKSDFYKKNEMRAAKLASEITKESSSNVHIASDRGLDLEMDEEELYGAVIRDDVSISEPQHPNSTHLTNEKPSASARTEEKADEGKETAPVQDTPAAIFSPSVTKKTTIIGSTTTPLNTNKHINDLYCDAISQRLRVDPSKVDPHWKSGASVSYLSTEEERPVPAYQPGYQFAPYGHGPMPPMAPPMGYAPYSVPYGYPMMPGQPPYVPGYSMMGGYPPH